MKYINAWEVSCTTLRVLLTEATKREEVKPDETVWRGDAGDVIVAKSASELDEEYAEYIDSGLVEEYIDD